MLVQIASILTCIVATSAATFSYHCMRLQLEAAAIHPPIMFCLLIVLLILPIDAVYKVEVLSFRGILRPCVSLGNKHVNFLTPQQQISIMWRSNDVRLVATHALTAVSRLRFVTAGDPTEKVEFSRSSSACMQDTRLFFTWTFWRVTTPFREVTFADFLLADILTSLAKALSDCERALCHLSTGPVMQPHDTDEVGHPDGSAASLSLTRLSSSFVAFL